MPFALLSHMFDGKKVDPMRWKTFLLPNQVVEKGDRRMIAAVVTGMVIMVWAWVPLPFLPSLKDVAHAINDLWVNQDLGSNVIVSLLLNAEAISIAAIISLLLAYLSTIALFRPAITFIGKLRFLSLAGLGFAFVLMTSNGTELRLLILVFMVVVFMIVSAVDVIAGIPKEQLDLARTLRMGEWQVLWEVVILGQADQMFIVWRQNAAMGYMMTATAESMSMSGGGIGTLLATSNKYLHLSEIMALQLTVLFFGLIQDSLIGYFRRTCCPWVSASGGRNK